MGGSFLFLLSQHLSELPGGGRGWEAPPDGRGERLMAVLSLWVLWGGTEGEVRLWGSELLAGPQGVGEAAA